MEVDVSDITITCVKWGDGSPHFEGRGVEYVNKLYAGVKRNIKRHTWEMVCFTDNATGIRPEVRCEPLPNNLKGTWPKIGLFRRDLAGIHTTRLFNLDLATVIVSDLDEVFDMDVDFAIAKNWPPEIKPDNKEYMSHAILMRVGARPQVWEAYRGDPNAIRGDQDWITKIIPGEVMFPYDWSQSYKARKLAGLPGPPVAAKWVCFHGVPKPHMCDDWVKEYWRE
jgi:hypothetical protein